MTGAARLASEAAMRMGAGLCTIVAPESAVSVYQASAPHILFEPLKEWKFFYNHLKDPRRKAAMIGPGAGSENAHSLKKLVLNALSLKKPVLLDADALTVFGGDAETLFRDLYPGCVLTPHEGEFTQLFADIKGTKKERAMNAATRAGAVVVLKGAETVIASPDGECVVNTHSSPYLATAGSGDVLAGMVAGFLTQGVKPFDAACASVWMHGEAGIRFGPGLVAPDIITEIPHILKSLI